MEEQQNENSLTSYDLNNEKRKKVLEMTIYGKKDKEIMAEAGISRMTLYRWRNYDGDFMEALAERRKALREMANNGLLEMTETALEAVWSALADKDPKIRLQAAKLVFSMLKLDKEEKESSIMELLKEASASVKKELGVEGDKY